MRMAWCGRALFLVCIILVLTPTQCCASSSSSSSSYSSSYFQWRNHISFLHSLMRRVANLRAARGDHAGSARAILLAQKLDQGLGLGLGLGFWRMASLLGWDYLKNYAWRIDVSPRDMIGAVSDIDELIRRLTELSLLNSSADRASWVRMNYSEVLRVLKSILRRLLKVFRQQGALREVVMGAWREVVEGELLRDCLELGTEDIRGLKVILQEVVSSVFSPSQDFRADL